MGHYFKKQFGQNFLRSDRFAQKLVDALSLSKDDNVIEVGPGDGRVTNLLLQTEAQVTCVEIDYSLIPNLIKRFSSLPNWQIKHMDILDLSLTDLPVGYKLAGSLPYNISKQIILKFLTAANPPQAMSFIVQEEVAWEYVASTPKATFLSNWIRLYADVKKLESIPASQFFPQPKVNGAILFIQPYTQPLANVETLHQLLRIGFATPRKTLRNNLMAGFKLSGEIVDQAYTQLGLAVTARPAELTPTQWQQLSAQLDL